MTYISFAPSLPELRKEAHKQFVACLAQLARLPELLTTDATAETVQRVCGFCTRMQNIVYGRSDDKSFVHRCREVDHTLALAIRSTAPDFRPFLDKHRYRRPDEPSFQRVEDEFMGYANTTSMSSRRSVTSLDVESTCDGDTKSTCDAGALSFEVDPKDLTDVRRVIKE